MRSSAGRAEYVGIFGIYHGAALLTIIDLIKRAEPSILLFIVIRAMWCWNTPIDHESSTTTA
jgi:hypothetical protein